MRSTGLVVGGGPIRSRQNDRPLDTDDERDLEFFVVMSFCDRAQVDAAYDHILPLEVPAEAVHYAVFSKLHNPTFIRWQDLDAWRNAGEAVLFESGRHRRLAHGARSR